MFKSEDDYLSKLLESGDVSHQKHAVLDAIEKGGVWEECVEWRISTYTETSISPEKFKDEDWFRVVVKCDYEFSCVCPTVDRALEMVALYQQLIFKLFRQVGWPSWATSNSVKPE
ncbi:MULTISPECIES: hypothetical protein [Shewanella]|uniref:hypothetical protein n=1 Tax=Shewanella TaxID=22 RepID=UPI00249416B1|nr:hypothetical protein [Shewanella japonica]